MRTPAREADDLNVNERSPHTALQLLRGLISVPASGSPGSVKFLEQIYTTRSTYREGSAIQGWCCVFTVVMVVTLWTSLLLDFAFIPKVPSSTGADARLRRRRSLFRFVHHSHRGPVTACAQV